MWKCAVFQSYKPCRQIDRWSACLASDRLYMYSDRAKWCTRIRSVCACATRKLDFRVGCHAAQRGGKWALGASDQSVHQFTGTLEGLLLLFFFYTCLHLLFVTFPLSHPFPLPITPVLLFLLPWCEPSVTLMKKHVLCDSPLLNQYETR